LSVAPVVATTPAFVAFLFDGVRRFVNLILLFFQFAGRLPGAGAPPELQPI
jgi:hypothetical protein